ncbi:glycoside hydrolase family 3 protein [Roridomyces roridus]|uniref:beta-glucosidase n=1 Tax=Roridomyces roridus TaxID=1738132 RepID=A0AAD7FPQ6_9AGAR|nr:glycoside hydrolase family 3 protein [Roridomyces roridus]
MDRSFLHADIPTLVKKLAINDKISLLGAPNFWNTTSISSRGISIPSIRFSDGPNGVRGSSHFVASPSQCIPCETAMASTFDPELIEQVGRFLAAEAKCKSSVVLLAPTCNIPRQVFVPGLQRTICRSPLGGRAFESFSEDPHLSGTMAASYVNGLQAEGVSATIKHFVANDQEHEASRNHPRTAAESVVSDRALREVYLYPFMLAQKHAKPSAFMTSYGRLKGIHCAENRHLLQDLLRDEWGFDNGLILSDWYGTYSVDEALNAGLDLEMPGPSRWRTPTLVNHCLTAQKLSLATLNERVQNVLNFVQKQARRNPDVVYGDGVERTRDSPENRKFCRQLAAEGIVLLKNDEDLMPLTSKTKKLAIIGPNALQHIISGGGSAALKPSYAVSPYDGVVAGAPPGVTVQYELGCYAHKYLPTLENSLKTVSGEPGWLCTFYNHDAQGHLTEPVATFVVLDTRIKLVDFLPPGLTPTWTIKLTGRLTVEKTAPFELGLTVAGRAKLWVNGELTIDNWTSQTPGDFFYGQGTIEEKAIVDLTAEIPVDILVEYTNTSPPAKDEDDISSQPALMLGVRLGGCEKIDPDVAIQSAVALAAESDAVLFVGGLTPEWESEGFDRPTLSLPGRQDEVIAKIAAANPNTIVCIQAGSATSMPWIAAVNSVMQTWYLGNEVGNAIGDIVWGKVNPSGKLPLTFPVCIEDTPAFLNQLSENGKIHYREDLFVGYKHYHARNVKPLFEFGFGLSYTKFSFSNLVVSDAEIGVNELTFRVTVTIKNTGLVVGSEVAQLYITFPPGGPTTPTHQLKGFAKAKDVSPGCSRDVSINLDKYAVSFWDTNKDAWTVSPGKYIINVGASSADFRLRGELDLKEGFTWKGL